MNNSMQIIFLWVDEASFGFDTWVIIDFHVYIVTIVQEQLS